MDMRQWVINLAAKLRKQFPEQGGVFAVTMQPPPQMSLYDGFTGDPTDDDRPDFVKADEVGWTRLNVPKGK